MLVEDLGRSKRGADRGEGKEGRNERGEDIRGRSGRGEGRRADPSSLGSFFASTYTTLRTLLPLLPAHPLTRRITGSAVGSYDAPPQAPIEKRARLTSAQRFTVWLTAVDIGEFLSCRQGSEC
mgnify:CR=1 FL=1